MNKSLKIILQSVFIISVSCGLYFISRYNYLLFHYIVEFTSITIGITIFLLAINTLNISKSLFMLLVGTTFFTSSLIDFFHALSYKGQNIFPGFDSNLPTQLWIAARFIQIAGLFIAAFLLKKTATRKNTAAIIIIFSIAFLAIFSSTFIFKVFPACYIQGTGVTLFKKIAEYLFSAIALWSIIIFILEGKKLKKQKYHYVIASLIFFIASELSFTLYVDVYGFFNMLGHIFKLLSFYFTYRYFIATNLRDPFNLLFNNLVEKSNELKLASTIDRLTGLKNQMQVFDETKKQFEIAKRFQKDFSVIIIDIDNFKKINDVSGHSEGDKALRFMAETIDRTVREVDIKGRYGGDEFLIAPIDADASTAAEIAYKIQENLEDRVASSNFSFEKFTFSAGIAVMNEKITFDELLAEADSALIKSKKLGKNRITIYDRNNS